MAPVRDRKLNTLVQISVVHPAEQGLIRYCSTEIVEVSVRSALLGRSHSLGFGEQPKSGPGLWLCCVTALYHLGKHNLRLFSMHWSLP